MHYLEKNSGLTYPSPQQYLPLRLMDSLRCLETSNAPTANRNGWSLQRAGTMWGLDVFADKGLGFYLQQNFRLIWAFNEKRVWKKAGEHTGGCGEGNAQQRDARHFSGRWVWCQGQCCWLQGGPGGWLGRQPWGYRRFCHTWQQIMPNRKHL